MTKITKAEFDALPDALKAKFEADGDNYILQEQDVEGLKKSKAEILEEKKRIQAERDELAKFKADKEAADTEAQTEAEKKAGEFAKVEQRYKDRIAEIEKTAADKESAFLGNLKRERLKNFLQEKGVLPDRAAYALTDTFDQFDLVSDESGFSLKLKNGIGDAKELDGAVEALKAKAPFLFAANGASGSGASGSQQGSGSPAKTWTRAQWDSADSESRLEFSKAKGQVTD